MFSLKNVFESQFWLNLLLLSLLNITQFSLFEKKIGYVLNAGHYDHYSAERNVNERSLLTELYICFQTENYF